MGTNCLIWCGVVLLVADEQRSYFMTNGNLPPVGVRLSFVRGLSFLRPMLVCPLSVTRYARCIPILCDFCFPHLAVCLLRGTHLSVVRGLLCPLCLNSLGLLLPILSNSNYDCTTTLCIIPCAPTFAPIFITTFPIITHRLSTFRKLWSWNTQSKF